MSSEEKYFAGDELALHAWISKYRLGDESLDEFFERIASEFARLDTFVGKATNLPSDKLDALSGYGKSIVGNDPFARFYHLFYNFKYIIPGGSVLAGIGSGKPVSLSNCFVIPTNDSIEDIFKTASNMSQIYKRRGGVGVDLSTLRPNGAVVNNAAKSTGGVVPFMELFSQVTNTIGQAGRRGALMISIDVNHPDIQEFVTIKQDLTKVTGANVSVRLNDKFMEAVENDEDYMLHWPCQIEPLEDYDDVMQELNYNELTEAFDKYNGKFYVKKIKAKELWDSIIHCAWATAEPGILFWDTILDNDPASVYPKHRAISTNPCGEIPLSPYDSCRLIAVNLFGLVRNPFTSQAIVDEQEAYQIFYEAQVIGDILVDLEIEAVEKIISITSGDEKKLWMNIKDTGMAGRRTGVGITGLADMLAALNSKYTDTALIDTIMNIKMRAELDATIDLAIINGTFPDYNPDLEYLLNKENKVLGGTNTFYNFLDIKFPEQALKMRTYGRRNISFSTIAPTGTISILAGTSSGCEPVFSLYYTRRKKCNPGEAPDFVDQNGVGFKNYNVIHPKLQVWYNTTEKELGDNLSIVNKTELDELIKKSPWYGNTAEDIKPEDRVKVQSTLQKYTTHSISSTVNVAADVDEEFISTIYTEAFHRNCKGITVYRDGSRSGILIKTEDAKPIITERPIELECKVEQFKNEKKDWIAIIGLLNGQPYEIFTGPKDIDIFPIPSAIEKGFIIKVKVPDEPSRYDFRYVDSYGYTNTLGGLSRVFDKEYWNYGRLISGYLRSGIPIEQVIKIVNGLTFTNKGLNNWKSGVIRSLKQFIPDGTKVHGAICENCGSTNVVYEGGCMICRDCASSKCG